MTATIEDASAVAARKARWKQFLAPDAEPGFLFHLNYPDPDANLPPWGYPRPDNAGERIERAWRLYEWQTKKTAWIHDDRVPYLDNTTGTEIFAEALGCTVECPQDNMPFAHAYVRTANDAAKVTVPELSASSLAYLFDIADDLHRRAGSEAVMKLIDVQSPMDVAALVWKKEDLFVAMIEEPDAVKDLAAKARQLMIAFFDEWFRRYGTEYISHCPEYFMSGGLTLSEDEIGAVNAEMMEEFFLPELEIPVASLRWPRHPLLRRFNAPVGELPPDPRTSRPQSRHTTHAERKCVHRRSFQALRGPSRTRAQLGPFGRSTHLAGSAACRLPGHPGGTCQRQRTGHCHLRGTQHASAAVSRHTAEMTTEFLCSPTPHFSAGRRFKTASGSCMDSSQTLKCPRGGAGLST